jgi:hypothetical protein
LQDFYITLMSEYADVSLGQFKIPVSYEGMNSASKVLFPERAPVARHYGDRRDMGIKMEKQFEYVGYVLGLFNGQGQNQVDTNNQKDLALRLEGYPMKGIMVGAVGYVALGQRAQPGTKDRVEADLKLEFENALLLVEYIHGWDGPSGARVEGHGAYGALGYTFAEQYQPVVRVGFLDGNVDGADTAITSCGGLGGCVHYELGFNYYLLKQELKFQAAYGRTESSLNGESGRNEGILAAQLSF